MAETKHLYRVANRKGEVLHTEDEYELAAHLLFGGTLQATYEIHGDIAYLVDGR